MNGSLSLTGAEEKLKAGANVADVGCGHGASTIIMAKAYPHSTFHGYDVHEKSIEPLANVRRTREFPIE